MGALLMIGPVVNGIRGFGGLGFGVVLGIKSCGGEREEDNITKPTDIGALCSSWLAPHPHLPEHPLQSNGGLGLSAACR